MPNKLETSLKTYPDLVLRNAENLVRTGLSLEDPALDQIKPVIGCVN
jgi:hypothetical protein